MSSLSVNCLSSCEKHHFESIALPRNFNLLISNVSSFIQPISKQNNSVYVISFVLKSFVYSCYVAMTSFDNILRRVQEYSRGPFHFVLPFPLLACKKRARWSSESCFHYVRQSRLLFMHLVPRPFVNKAMFKRAYATCDHRFIQRPDPAADNTTNSWFKTSWIKRSELKPEVW